MKTELGWTSIEEKEKPDLFQGSIMYECWISDMLLRERKAILKTRQPKVGETPANPLFL